MELAEIMNLDSLTIKEHITEIDKFFDINKFTFMVDIKHVVYLLSENEEIKSKFKERCNKVFHNVDSSRQIVVLDFDKTTYVTLDDNHIPVQYTGTAEEWLKNPVDLYVLVTVKSKGLIETKAKPIINKSQIRLLKYKLTDVLNIRTIINKLVKVCLTDSVSGYSYGNTNLFIRCDSLGRPCFTNKHEDIDLSYLCNDVYVSDIIDIMDSTKYLTSITNDIAEHTSFYPFNIIKVYSENDTLGVYVGEDARILAWHKCKLEELERKQEYVELNGIMPR